MRRRLRGLGILATAAAITLAACATAGAVSTSGTDSRQVPARVFRSDSPYYQKLPASTPSAADSAAMVSSLNKQAHDYYGSPTTANVAINTAKFAPPLYVARNSDPVYNITGWNCQGKTGNWAGELNQELANVHLPADLQADPSSDGTISVYNVDTKELVELWKGRKVDGQWQTCWGGKIARADQNIGVFSKTFGASAGGLAHWGYTIRQQELLDGHIDHVINLNIPLTKKSSYSWPAVRTDGWVNGQQLSIGQMLRLPASLDIDSMKLSPVAKTIAKAAQEYGIIISDTSGSVQFAAENPIGLANNQYSTIFRGRYSSQEMAGNPALGEVAFPLDKLVALPMDYQAPVSTEVTTSEEDETTPSTPSATPTSTATTTTAPTVTPPSATPSSGATVTNKTYAKTVKKYRPYLYWRLSDAGSSAKDSSGRKRTGKLRGLAQQTAPGAIAGNTAVRSYGNAASTAYLNRKLKGQQKFTVQVWINTTTQTGGKILGFENTKTSGGSRFDRSLYLTDSGKLVFGTQPGRKVSTVTSPASYNDGAWHLVTATVSGSGTKLYVDGALVASNSQSKAWTGSGYWRLGGGGMYGWPQQPSSSYYSGGLDEFTIYSSALSAAQIAKIYQAAR